MVVEKGRTPAEPETNITGGEPDIDGKRRFMSTRALASLGRPRLRLRCTRCFVTEDAYRSLAAHGSMLNPQSKVFVPGYPPTASRSRWWCGQELRYPRQKSRCLQ